MHTLEKMKTTCLALLFLLVLNCHPALRAQTVNINATVDPTTVLVTNYEGWGSSLCWWANVVGGLPTAPITATWPSRP